MSSSGSVRTLRRKTTKPTPVPSAILPKEKIYSCCVTVAMRPTTPTVLVSTTFPMAIGIAWNAPTSSTSPKSPRTPCQNLFPSNLLLVRFDALLPGTAEAPTSVLVLVYGGLAGRLGMSSGKALGASSPVASTR